MLEGTLSVTGLHVCLEILGVIILFGAQASCWRLLFFITGKLKWEQSLHPHSRAVGKTPQGHTDKMNLSKDQIVPMDHKTGCWARAKVCRNRMLSEKAVGAMEFLAEGVKKTAKEKKKTSLDVTDDRDEAMPCLKAIRTIASFANT